MSDDLKRRVLYALSHAVPLELLEVVPVAALTDAVVAELTRQSDDPDLDAEPCDCQSAKSCYGGKTWGHWVPAEQCRQYTIGFRPGAGEGAAQPEDTQ